MQEKEQKQPLAKNEIIELENTAIESSTHGDKPYRKKYRQGFDLVTCHDCGNFYGLYLITEERPTRKFKTSSKKNRNRIPLLTPDGNKVYLDRECINKRVKKAKSA